jgi:hypothetical protein
LPEFGELYPEKFFPEVIEPENFSLPWKLLSPCVFIVTFESDVLPEAR